MCSLQAEYRDVILQPGYSNRKPKGGIVGIRSKMNACVLAVAMLGAPLAASAAGFGKMTVLSNLGQPLSAEIDLVSVQPEEVQNLAVRLAPPDSFQERGVDYNSYLRSFRFQVARRDSGQYYIRVSSSQAINEPFVDFLVEMTWTGGRIVRQYTDVLDPADYAASSGSKTAVVNVPQGEARTTRSSPTAQALPDEGGRPSAVRQKRARKAVRPAATPVEQQVAPAAKAAPADATGKEADTHRVRRGENLGQIAGRYKPGGVSLDQMLYGLYKNNSEAFVNQNINRLKSGAILRIPPKQEVAAVSSDQAANEIKAHASDWNAYKQGVAASVEKTPLKTATPQNSSTGKITAKAEDKATPAATGPRDVVKLSKGEAGKGATPSAAAQQRIRNLEEESAARERALKEANERVALLEKNVTDMQRLLELKSKAAAELQKKSETSPKTAAVPPAAVKPAVTPPAKPAVVPPAAVTPPPVVKPVASAPLASAVKAPVVASAAIASSPKASATAASAAAASAVAASTPVVAPLPPAEPVKPASAPIQVDEAPAEESFLADNAPMMFGGALALSLLGAALFFVMRKRRSRPSFEDSVLTGGDLKSNTVLGSVGASIVDTSSTTDNSFFTDFSREGLGTIDTDEVDPVAEAEVYMAYGRDAQAEEILKDALIKDGSRQEVRLKLMEIYATRQNLANFELYALELHSATNGAGPLWDKAAAMGRELDANNALYQDAPAAPAPTPVESSLASLVTDHAAESPAVAEEMDLDFEIGTVKMQAPVFEAPVVPAEEAAVDFDLGGAQDDPAAEDTASALDFDFSAAPAPEAPAPLAAPAEKAETPILDFHFDLGEVGAGPAPAEETVRMSVPTEAAQPSSPSTASIIEETTTMGGEVPLNFSFGDLDLNLDKAENIEAVESFEALEAPASEADDGGALGFSLDELDGNGMTAVEDPIETKLDLAKAYIEMGDAEGAREILNEAASEGSDEQRQRAERMLADI